MKGQKKKVFLILVLVALTTGAFAQVKGVGIGTTNPDASAVLHISDPDQKRGLLIPELSTDRLALIPTPIKEGLVVYNTTIQRFIYYKGGQWYLLDALQATTGSTTATYSGNVTITGTMSASSYELNATGNGPIPAGGIIMWSGTTVPFGWQLCDGSNGSPDLRGRFIVSSGQNATPQTGDLNPNYVVNEKGGWNNYRLQTTHMPSHSHTMNSAGAHVHDWNYTLERDDDNTGGSYDEFTRKPRVEDTGRYIQNPMASAGAHTHTINSTGGGTAHENRPSYYVLAFIMKL